MVTDRWVGHSPKIACESTKFKDFDHSDYTWYTCNVTRFTYVGARTQIDKMCKIPFLFILKILNIDLPFIKSKVSISKKELGSNTTKWIFYGGRGS